jgi:hypothetical protein
VQSALFLSPCDSNALTTTSHFKISASEGLGGTMADT